MARSARRAASRSRCGPIVGGLLTDGFGWEAVFYINLPIGILSFIVIQTKLVNVAGRPTRVDYPGVVTFSVAMFLAIYATIRANEAGWTSGLILGLYAAAIVLFVAFLVIEMRRRHPMMDLSLFRKRTFVGANLAAFTMAFASITLLFYLTVWFQSILGYSPIEAGLRLVVFTGAGLSVAPIAGAISEKRSPRITLTFGLLLIAAGSLSMSFVLESDSAWTAIIPGMILGGWGTGIINPIMAAASLGVVPPSQGGIASGTNNTFREAGQTAGIAVLGTLLHSTVRTEMESELAGTPLGARGQRARGSGRGRTHAEGRRRLARGAADAAHPGRRGELRGRPEADLHRVRCRRPARGDLDGRTGP